MATLVLHLAPWQIFGRERGQLKMDGIYLFVQLSLPFAPLSQFPPPQVAVKVIRSIPLGRNEQYERLKSVIIFLYGNLGSNFTIESHTRGINSGQTQPPTHNSLLWNLFRL